MCPRVLIIWVPVQGPAAPAVRILSKGEIRKLKQVEAKKARREGLSQVGLHLVQSGLTDTAPGLTDTAQTRLIQRFRISCTSLQQHKGTETC